MIYIGSGAFTEVGDFIHKRNPGGQICIGGVFGHFSGAFVHVEDRIALANERFVEEFHHLAGAGRRKSDHHAVRFHKIFNRYAFAEKFGVGDNIKEIGRQIFQHQVPDFFGRAYRNGALIYNDLV